MFRGFLVSRRKIHPPDEEKKDEKRIEFMAPSELHAEFHTFKYNYGHKNAAEALAALLKVAKRYPNLFKKTSF